jgi:hypothetical protein
VTKRREKNMNRGSRKWSRIIMGQGRGYEGKVERRVQQGGEKLKDKENDERNKGKRGKTGIRRNVSNIRREGTNDIRRRKRSIRNIRKR